MPSAVNVMLNLSIIIIFLPDRPTHLHEREGDGNRNLLLGLPNYTWEFTETGAVTQRSLYRDLFNQNGMDFVTEYLL